MRQWMKASVFFAVMAAMLAGFCMTASASLDADSSAVDESEAASSIAELQNGLLESSAPQPKAAPAPEQMPISAEENKNPDTGMETLTVPLAAAALVLGTAAIAVTAKSKY